MKTNTIIAVLLLSLIQITTVFADSNYSCSVNDEGKAVVIDSRSPTKPLAVSKVKNTLAKAKSKLTSKRNSIKSNRNLSKSAKKKKLASLKAKEILLKEDLSIVRSCKNNTPTAAGTLTSTIIMSQGKLLKHPNGITCQLSTGITAQLTADYGSAQFTSDSADRIVGLLGCKTNDGRKFDATFTPTKPEYVTISGFIYSAPEDDTPLETITFFSKDDISPSASVFVVKLCEDVTFCTAMDRVHFNHRFGSLLSIKVDLEFGPYTGRIDFDGIFGGQGR